MVGIELASNNENLKDNNETREDAIQKFDKMGGELVVDAQQNGIGTAVPVDKLHEGHEFHIDVYKDNPNRRNDGIPEIKGTLLGRWEGPTKILEIRWDNGDFYKLSLSPEGVFDLSGKDGELLEDIKDFPPDKVINESLPKFKKRLDEAKIRKTDPEAAKLRRLQELSHLKEQEEAEDNLSKQLAAL